MATVLLAWELGDGLGHDQRLLRLGHALAGEGHQPVFALGNVAESWPLFQAHPSFPVLQAPYWNYWPGRNTFRASSYADVLAVRGWETADILAPLVRAWQQLIDYVQPGLVVADHAPTLCLAAYRTLPVVQVGGWFTMPPVNAPTFPTLVSRHRPVKSQEALLAVAQEVQRRRQRPVPPTLTDIFAAADRFPMFVPELDPYQSQRQEPAWEPLEPLATVTQAGYKNGFFAYLSADNPDAEIWLTRMASRGFRGKTYLRAASGPTKERLRSQGLTVLDEPAPLADMLAESAIIVHHGGITTATAAFVSGRPQIVFPRHLEQALTADLLAKLGVGVGLPAGTSPAVADEALPKILSERRWSDNAAGWAARVRERPRRPALPAILECCGQRLRQRAEAT